jgi:hypothetical protein
MAARPGDGLAKRLSHHNSRVLIRGPRRQANEGGKCIEKIRPSQVAVHAAADQPTADYQERTEDRNANESG